MVGRSTWAAGGRPKRLERRRGGAFSILDWNKRMRQSSFNVRWAVGFPIEVAVARQSVADQGLRLRSASREGRRASRRTEVQSFAWYAPFDYHRRRSGSYSQMANQSWGDRKPKRNGLKKHNRHSPTAFTRNCRAVLARKRRRRPGSDAAGRPHGFERLDRRAGISAMPCSFLDCWRCRSALEREQPMGSAASVPRISQRSRTWSWADCEGWSANWPRAFQYRTAVR
jgi:hypothetical protein